MKFLAFTGLLVLYLFLGLFNNELEKKITEQSGEKYYSQGLLKTELDNVENIADYSFKIDLEPAKDLINVEEEIIWRNKTNYSTGEIYFHLYANAYKSNNTIFSSYYKLGPENKTEFEFSEILVNGVAKKFVYENNNKNFPKDSTVAKISLGKEINPNDSVIIRIKYRLKIPVSVKRFGKARGVNFYFVSQWFPKVGVFENGKWICEPYYPYLNFYSDFGKYEAVISVPKNYKVAANGKLDRVNFTGEKNIFRFIQNGVHDYAWVASDNLLHRKGIFTRRHGTGILLNFYIQPERKKYFERYLNAVKNSLLFFEENIGEYPYQTLTLVDVPRASASSGMEYPTLFTVSAPLISPVETHSPEKLVAHEFSHQYFQGILANNEVYEAWLDEGFASYTASKIMEKYYGNGFLSFRLASYYPVYGVNFLSYNEIPVIYSIEKIPYNEYDKSLSAYYRNLTLGSIADTSYKLPNRLSYRVNAYAKPELMLYSLERVLGKEKMFKILRAYFDEYKFKHPKGIDFIELVKDNSGMDLNWFFENIYEKPALFDYKIKSLRKVTKNKYKLFLERIGDGVFPVEIFVYTESDTLRKFWDGQTRWKILEFSSDRKVLGAEIDPYRKNLFDLNFANNSILVSSSYSASLALSANWFFWLQNALMIFGGI